MKTYSVTIRNSQNSKYTGGLILLENGKVKLIVRNMPYDRPFLASWNEYNPIGCTEEQMLSDIRAMSSNEVSVRITLICKQ